MWTKPTATEIRFGFEVTMYVMNKQLFQVFVIVELKKLQQGNNDSQYPDQQDSVIAYTSAILK